MAMLVSSLHGEALMPNQQPAPPELENLDAEQLLKQRISEHKFIMFSKTYCGYCKHLKNLFKLLNLPYTLVELDLLGKRGNQFQEALYHMTGQRTVPSVWLNGKHLGGCDDTVSLHESGKLREMLQEAGIQI